MTDVVKDNSSSSTESDVEELEDTAVVMAETDRAPAELEATKPETHYVEFDALSNSTGIEEDEEGGHVGDEDYEEQRNNIPSAAPNMRYNDTNGTTEKQQQYYSYENNNNNTEKKVTKEDRRREAEYTTAAQAALPAVLEELAEKRNAAEEANFYAEQEQEEKRNNHNIHNSNSDANHITGSAPSTSNTVNSALFHPAHDVDEEQSGAATLKQSKRDAAAAKDKLLQQLEHEEEEEEYVNHPVDTAPAVAVPALYLTRPSAHTNHTTTTADNNNEHRGRPTARTSSGRPTPRRSHPQKLHANTITTTARTSSPTPRLTTTTPSSRRSQSLNSLNSATSQLTGQILHRASIVSAARYFTSRRASSVINRVGLHDYDNPNRRTNLTEAEVFALEKMAENEARRQSVLERAAELQLARDALIVEQEEAHEAELQRRLREREATRERLLKESSAERTERFAAARARRAAHEKARQALLSHQIHAEEQVISDPFSVWYTKHRFSTPQLRGQSPIAPGRKTNTESAPQGEIHGQQQRRHVSPPGRTQTPQRRYTAPANINEVEKMKEEGLHSAATRQGRSPGRNGHMTASPLRWRSPSARHDRPWR